MATSTSARDLYDRMHRTLQIYVSAHSHRLWPIMNNLQPPFTSPSGETTFPLGLETLDLLFRSDWPDALILLNSLKEVFESADSIVKTNFPVEWKYCQDWIEQELEESKELPLDLDFNTCFWTMKLKVNVSQEQTMLNCGHESAMCVVTMLGDFTETELIVGENSTTAKVGPMFTIDTDLPLRVRKFEGTMYQIELFLPPVGKRMPRTKLNAGSGAAWIGFSPWVEKVEVKVESDDSGSGEQDAPGEEEAPVKEVVHAGKEIGSS